MILAIRIQICAMRHSEIPTQEEAKNLFRYQTGYRFTSDCREFI